MNLLKTHSPNINTLSSSSEPPPLTFYAPEDCDLNNDLLNGMEVSIEDYWKYYYTGPEFTYEWNEGKLERKPMTNAYGVQIYRWFGSLLDKYFESHPIGISLCLEYGFYLSKKRSPGSVRRPDLGIVLDRNPIPVKDLDNSYQGIYDLCVESLSHSSPKEIRRDLINKKKEYARVGVQEFYILDSKHEQSAFYYLNDQNEYDSLPVVEKGVIQSILLPGFAFRLKHLKTLPQPESLISDSVYSPYVSLEFQREREFTKRILADREMVIQAKEKAQELAEQERRDKEKEREAKEKAQNLVEKERKAKEKERKAKEKERKAKEKEREAKEKEREAKEKEQKAKEKAQNLAGKEREAKEKALAEIKHLKTLLFEKQKHP